MTGDMLNFTIRRHADGQTVTAVLNGAWDGLTDGTLTAQLHTLIEVEGFRNVIIDATDLSFVDSGRLGALVGLHRATAAQGGWLRVASPPRAVRRPLALTGLDTVLEVTDSPDDPARP